MKKGYRKPRKIRPVEKNIPKGYDSGWEYTLHNSVLKSWNHHTKEVAYIIEHIRLITLLNINTNQTLHRQSMV